MATALAERRLRAAGMRRTVLRACSLCIPCPALTPPYCCKPTPQIAINVGAVVIFGYLFRQDWKVRGCAAACIRNSSCEKQTVRLARESVLAGAPSLHTTHTRNTQAHTLTQFHIQARDKQMVRLARESVLAGQRVRLANGKRLTLRDLQVRLDLDSLCVPQQAALCRGASKLGPPSCQLPTPPRVKLAAAPVPHVPTPPHATANTHRATRAAC